MANTATASRAGISRAARVRKAVTVVVFVSLAASVVFLVWRIGSGGGVMEPAIRGRGDYVLMLLQCVVGLVALGLPSLVQRRFSVQMPDSFLTLFFIFLFCAIYLGEVRSFYYVVPYWDTILHTFSGVMLGALGFSVVLLLNDAKTVGVTLSPAFIALFAGCFAVTWGVVWEFYEYAVDGLLGLNMQKTSLADGTALTGTAALSDTIKDLAVDCAGALSISVVGFIMMKAKPGWLNRFDFQQVQPD
ncbi:MAG: hypothetical protein LBI99_01340 [Propionibacteriaceae bacterium]|jgi:hypothetical protein|nr:hypothetical protein [Propionibacteriaceae bacterium]